MISCGLVRLFIPIITINVSSEYFRQNAEFMCSRQSVWSKYKNQYFIGMLPTVWWYHMVRISVFDFMWSHQGACPKSKYQCGIGVLPTERWFHVVPSDSYSRYKNPCLIGVLHSECWIHVFASECLTPIERPVFHRNTSDSVLISCGPIESRQNDDFMWSPQSVCAK